MPVKLEQIYQFQAIDSNYWGHLIFKLTPYLCCWKRWKSKRVAVTWGQIHKNYGENISKKLKNHCSTGYIYSVAMM